MIDSRTIDSLKASLADNPRYQMVMAEELVKGRWEVGKQFASAAIDISRLGTFKSGAQFITKHDLVTGDNVSRLQSVGEIALALLGAKAIKTLANLGDETKALTKTEHLAGLTSAGMLNISSDFGKVGIPVLTKNKVQKAYLAAVQNSGAGMSEANVVNKAWKEKIVMPDSPHTNGTPGHWFAMKRKAVELAKMDDVEKIYLNKGLSNEIPGATPNRRPDIMVKRTNGLIDQFEVPSKTDKLPNLLNRMRQNQSILGDKAGSIDILNIR